MQLHTQHTCNLVCKWTTAERNDENDATLIGGSNRTQNISVIMDDRYINNKKCNKWLWVRYTCHECIITMSVKYIVKNDIRALLCIKNVPHGNKNQTIDQTKMNVRLYMSAKDSKWQSTLCQQRTPWEQKWTQTIQVNEVVRNAETLCVNKACQGKMTENKHKTAFTWSVN